MFPAIRDAVYKSSEYKYLRCGVYKPARMREGLLSGRFKMSVGGASNTAQK